MSENSQDELIAPDNAKTMLNIGIESLKKITEGLQVPASLLESMGAKHQLTTTKLLQIYQDINKEASGILPSQKEGDDIKYVLKHVELYRELNKRTERRVPKGNAHIRTIRDIWDAACVLDAERRIALVRISELEMEIKMLSEKHGQYKKEPESEEDLKYWLPEDVNVRHVAHQLPIGDPEANLTIGEVAEKVGLKGIDVQIMLKERICRRWRYGMSIHDVIHSGIKMGRYYCADHFRVLVDEDDNEVENELIGTEVNGIYCGESLYRDEDRYSELKCFEHVGPDSFRSSTEITEALDCLHRDSGNRIRSFASLEEIITKRSLTC